MIIKSLKELQNSGRKIAFVKGNRDINIKNVESKKQSLTTFGGNIIPLMYVSGDKATADGCSLVDIDGNDIPAEKASEYIVIIDGQHRSYSAIKNGFDLSKITLFENYTDKNTKELLSEANIESSKWGSKDFIKGSVLFNPTELNMYASKLADRNFAVSTISKIICFNGSLTTTKYSDLMKGKTISVDYDLERANEFLEAVSKFEDKFVAKRYLIDEAIALSTTYGYKAVFKAISELTDKERELIKEVKRTDVCSTIRGLLNSKLTA
ncbi:hypothetical protein DSECCO2_146540 [anaerobic digester metagenome]